MLKREKLTDMGKGSQGWREEKQVLAAVTRVGCKGTGPRTSVKQLKPKKGWYHTPPSFASLIEVP